MLWVLFTFPSRYLFAIGLTRVFSLTGWSRRIRAEFLVFRVTQDTTRPEQDSCKGLSPAMVCLSRQFHSPLPYHNVVLQPLRGVATTQVWALPRSLATTGGIIVYFLFLRVLRCFSSPRSPPPSGGCPRCTRTGCPIQEPADQRLLAPPRGFSQLAAPFIAFLSHRHPPCALSCFRPSARLFGGRTHTLVALRPASLAEVCSFACFESRFLSSLLFHHVNELLAALSPPGWRITDSNR